MAVFITTFESEMTFGGSRRVVNFFETAKRPSKCNTKETRARMIFTIYFSLVDPLLIKEAGLSYLTCRSRAIKADTTRCEAVITIVNSNLFSGFNFSKYLWS